jgi:hypothetical protein
MSLADLYLPVNSRNHMIALETNFNTHNAHTSSIIIIGRHRLQGTKIKKQ